MRVQTGKVLNWQGLCKGCFSADDRFLDIL
jgi:hypothetical protein